MECRKFDNDSGISPVIGIILIIAITLVLSVVVYATIIVYEVKEPVFANIDIESVNISNQEVVLVHKGGDSFEVSDISIMISVNGATIPHNLIDLPANSVVGFGAPGGVFHVWSSDNKWDAGDRGWFRINENTNQKINSSDRVMINIVHRPTHTIISSPERRI
jgi:flagellin-like protein